MRDTLLNERRPEDDADRQMSVLVVEDDPALQRMSHNCFAAKTVRAWRASNRPDMARQLARAGVSLVILDLRLGREDGLDLVRELRASSDLPVIIITGHRCDDVDRVIG